MPRELSFSTTENARLVMNSSQRPLWLISLAFASAMSMLFGLIHVSDAIVRMELGSVSAEILDATLNPLYATLYLAGIAISWNQKRIGYASLLVLSSLSSWGFLGHTAGLTPPNLTEIGRVSGVFFVFVVLIGEVASVSALILSIYALSRPISAAGKHIETHSA